MDEILNAKIDLLLKILSSWWLHRVVRNRTSLFFQFESLSCIVDWWTNWWISAPTWEKSWNDEILWSSNVSGENNDENWRRYNMIIRIFTMLHCSKRYSQSERIQVSHPFSGRKTKTKVQITFSHEEKCCSYDPNIDLEYMNWRFYLKWKKFSINVEK